MEFAQTGQRCRCGKSFIFSKGKTHQRLKKDCHGLKYIWRFTASTHGYALRANLLSWLLFRCSRTSGMGLHPYCHQTHKPNNFRGIFLGTPPKGIRKSYVCSESKCMNTESKFSKSSTNPEIKR